MWEIIDIPYIEIDVIKNLWEKNRLYHVNSSEFFKESYQDIAFDERIQPFSAYDTESIKISVAKINDECVGYCLSTIIEGKGEIESLHVNELHRGKGIGKQLVTRHLDWMREQKCKLIGVTVSQENKSTINFYKTLGFFPNTLYLQLK